MRDKNMDPRYEARQALNRGEVHVAQVWAIIGAADAIHRLAKASEIGLPSRKRTELEARRGHRSSERPTA